MRQLAAVHTLAAKFSKGDLRHISCSSLLYTLLGHTHINTLAYKVGKGVRKEAFHHFVYKQINRQGKKNPRDDSLIHVVR